LIKYLIILSMIFNIMGFLILLLAFGMIISSLFVYKYVAVRYKDIPCGFSFVYLQCRFIMYFPCRESCSCLCCGPVNWFPLHNCYSLISISNLLYNYEIELNNLLYRLWCRVCLPSITAFLLCSLIGVGFFFMSVKFVWHFSFLIRWTNIS
jgi:hypothetical protein